MTREHFLEGLGIVERGIIIILGCPACDVNAGGTIRCKDCRDVLVRLARIVRTLHAATQADNISERPS